MKMILSQRELSHRDRSAACGPQEQSSRRFWGAALELGRGSLRCRDVELEQRTKIFLSEKQDITGVQYRGHGGLLVTNRAQSRGGRREYLTTKTRRHEGEIKKTTYKTSLKKIFEPWCLCGKHLGGESNSTFAPRVPISENHILRSGSCRLSRYPFSIIRDRDCGKNISESSVVKIPLRTSAPPAVDPLAPSRLRGEFNLHVVSSCRCGANISVSSVPSVAKTPVAQRPNNKILVSLCLCGKHLGGESIGGVV